MIKYVKKENIQLENLSDEFMEDVLVINSENDCVLVLNYSAAMILSALETPLSIFEIMERIAEKFKEMPENIQDEIADILTQFEREELINIFEHQ